MVTFKELVDRELLLAQQASQDYAATRRLEMQETKKQIERQFDQEWHQTALEHAKAITRTEDAFQTVYDANAVSDALARLHAQEAMENARLATEGLGATNTLALSLAHMRNDAQAKAQKQRAMDRLMADLDHYRMQLERAESAAKRQAEQAAQKDITATTQALEEQAFERARERQKDLLKQEKTADKSLKGTQPDLKFIAMPELVSTAGENSLKSVRETVVKTLQEKGMSQAWMYLAAQMKEGKITYSQLDDIAKEFGILSPSQQEFYTAQKGGGRYKAGVDDEQFKQISHAERESEETPPFIVDEAYLLALFHDYGIFIGDLEAESESITYDNATSVYDSYTQRAERLCSRVQEVQQYLDENRTDIGEENYKALSDSLSQILTGQQKATEYLSQIVDAVENFDQEQALAQLDVAEQEAILRAMESSQKWLEYTIFKRDNLYNSPASDEDVMQQVEKLDQQIANVLEGHGCKSHSELIAAVQQRRALIREAKYVQEGIRLKEEALADKRFLEYSTQDTNVQSLKYYEHMTKEEIGVYNYYYVTGGKEAAEYYLKYLQNTLNIRAGEEGADRLKGKPIRQLLFTITSSIGSFVGNLADMFNTSDEWIPLSANERQAQLVQEDTHEDYGAGWGHIYDAVGTISYMVPSILASLAVGTVSKTAGVAVGAALMGGATAGDAYTEAINKGFSKSEARMYSSLVAASEMGLQVLLGGVAELGGAVLKPMLNVVDDIDNAFAKVALTMGSKMVAEGNEEALQEMLTPVFEKLVTGYTEGVDVQAAMEAFLMGALTGGLIDTVGSGVSKAMTDTQRIQVGKAIKDSGTLQGLKDLALSLPEDTQAHALAMKIDETAGAYQVGKLFEAVSRDMNVDSAVHSLATQSTEVAVAPEVKQQQVLQDLLMRAEQHAATYEAASQTPMVTENVLREDGASTAETPASSTPSNLSPAKQAIVQKAMRQLDAYQKEHGITPQQRGVSSPQVSPKLSPAKQTAVQNAMQELEVYRKENNITPQQSTPTPPQTASIPQTVAPTPPTTSNTNRQRPTSKGEKTPQANVQVSPNTGTSLDTSLRGDYNKNGVDSKRTTSVAEWLRFPEQTHHFASNKNKKYTPMFESIVSKYGLDLDGEWNKEKMHHLGRHPDKYHKWVYRRLKMIDKIAKGDVSKFQLEFENIKRYIRDNPMLLRKKGWDE